ncbi:MAG: helix-turn-helix domain-containing protein [Candidatus Woesearchaeota archaeon]
MLSTKEVTNHLLELGLNNYEAKVYLTLVEEGVSTAKNVSDITGIPYGKVYEIITSLCTKGFSMTLPTKPMKCKALSPEDILNNVRNKEMAKFDNLEKVFESELLPLYMQSKQFNEPKGVFWIVNGRANINKKMETLIKKAKKSICILTSENGLKRTAFHKNLLKEAQERGVDIRIMSKMTKDNTEDCDLLHFCDICNTKIPITNNMISIDNEESIIVEPIPDDDNLMRGRDMGIWVLSKSFTEFMENMTRAQMPKTITRVKKAEVE